jgi:hypothetical protein
MQTKFYFICCCFFCVVGSAQNVVSGQITVSGGNPLAGSHIHIGKRRVSSDVSGIIRSENYQQEISKCSFRMLVINLLIHL